MVSNNSITSFMHYFSLYYAKASGKYQTSSLHRAAEPWPLSEGVSLQAGRGQAALLILCPSALMPLLWPRPGQTASDFTFTYKLMKHRKQSNAKAWNSSFLFNRRANQNKERKWCNHYYFFYSSLWPQFQPETPISVDKHRWGWMSKRLNCLSLSLTLCSYRIGSDVQQYSPSSLVLNPGLCRTQFVLE